MNTMTFSALSYTKYAKFLLPKLAALCLVFQLVGGLGRAQSSSSNMSTCINDVNGDPDLVIPACSAALHAEVISEQNRRKALNNRGIAYRNKGDYVHAIQDFEQAIQINPNDDKVLNNLGALYMNQGNYDRAIENYSKAIDLNADYFIAIKNRGAAYVNKSDYTRALADYDRAIQLEPRNPVVLQTRGILRFFVEDFQNAAKDIKEALLVDPSDIYSAIWYYLAQARSGQDARAELKEIAADLELTDWPGPVVPIFLGSAKPEGLIALGKASSTRYALDRECEANFYLGERALMDGNRAEAEKLFRAAVATGSSTNFEYRGALAELERLQARP